MGETAVTIDEWRRGATRLAAEVAAEVAADWGLALGAAYVLGSGGYVVRAERGDGTAAVLKLVYPHRESEQEADALERCDGDGAVRLLARDDDRHALLLERCGPGEFVSAASDDPLGVLVELLPRLWRSGDGFRALADEAEHWLTGADLAAMPPGRLRDAAVHYLRELAPTQGEQVLLHQDLNRLHRLIAELGLDRERARGWAIAQTVAWSDGTHPTHLEAADWLLEDAP